MTKIVYFAWVRDRVGLGEEEVELPAGVDTVADAMDWLAGRGEGYARAFANRSVVRAALDHRLVRPEAEIDGAGEIAFFPPMTGG